MHSILDMRFAAPLFALSPLVVVMASLLGACDQVQANDASATADVQSRSAADLTAAIDTFLENAWADAGIAPAADVTDEAFVRRVSLDLTGRIPTTDERAAFLDDPQSDRRALLIDTLLATNDHAEHMADVFDVLLMGRGSGRQLRARREHGWRQWLETAFRTNRPWNQMAETVLLARPADPADDAATWFLYERDNDYQQIAEAVAPAFFGFRIECAQCHDSMTAAEVEQAHYWGLVAFFNRGKNEMTDHGPRIVESAIGGFSEFADIEGASSPNLLTFLEANLVAEERPAGDEEQQESDDLYQASAREGEPRRPVFSRRERFVEDVVRDHPLLARAMVNRLWAMLMGRGLVHPFDEMDSAHEVAHPHLLDFLTDDFRSHGYDIRRTLRAIAGSRSYQQAARKPEGVDDPATFAWYLERPLTAEQFTRSLQVALLGASDAPPQQLVAAVREAMPDVLPDESVTGIAEPLFLSNGPALQAVIQEACEGPHPLAAMGAMPSALDATDALFLAALGRQPAPDEAATVAAFLTADERVGAARTEPATLVPSRLAHAAWAIVTSAEFRFNH